MRARQGCEMQYEEKIQLLRRDRNNCTSYVSMCDQEERLSRAWIMPPSFT